MNQPRKRRRKQPYKPGLGGDHGTGTAMANQNTTVEALTNDKGANPNNMGRRRRVEVIEELKFLSQRQYQAAKEIRDAYCKAKSLSSGSPLKEKVDASPKPDAVIAAQVDANSRLAKAMRGVPIHLRYVVEAVCWNNTPISKIRGKRRETIKSDLRGALTAAADMLDKG